MRNGQIKKMIKAIISSVILLSLVSLKSLFAFDINNDYAPKSVVVLDYSLLDDLLLLGIKPQAYAGCSLNENKLPNYLTKKVGDTSYLGSCYDVSMRQIFYIDPDLIIADKLQKSDYNQLQRLAPTMLLKGSLGNYKDQIENLEVLGITFKKRTKAHQIIKNFNAQLEQAVNLTKNKTKNIVIGYFRGQKFWALTTKTPASFLLKKLNKINLVKSDDRLIEALSFKQLEALNPDQIILLINNELPEVNEFKKSSKWYQLKAVKDYHVYFMSQGVWFDSSGLEATAIAIMQAKDTGFLSNQKFVIV